MNNELWQKYLQADKYQEEKASMQFIMRETEYNIAVGYLKTGKDDKILEIGVGNGESFFAMKKAGFDVYALDIRQDFEDERLTIGDMHDLPYSDEFFDLVFISHTLEHAISPYIVFSEIHRVLKMGGKLVIINPLYGGVDTFMPSHYYVLTDRQIANLAHQTGFVYKRGWVNSCFITPGEVKKDLIMIFEKTSQVNNWKNNKDYPVCFFMEGFKEKLGNSQTMTELLCKESTCEDPSLWMWNL